MSPIVDNPQWFLLGSAVLVLGCSLIKVDRYESNSLFNSDNYSRLLMSEDSFQRINPTVGTQFKYWLEEKECSKKVISVSEKNDSGYEIVLSNDSPKTYMSIISYKVGKGSIWSEIFK